MTLVLKIAVVIVVVLVVAVAALRIRKLRRDEIRELSRPVERRLMSPPPSPYAPSKGFRLLDGPLDSSRRPEPTRPRLETDREYVFSESQMAGDLDVVPTQLRHSEKWALTKSARRPASFTGLRVAIIAIVVILVVGALGFYLQHEHSPSTSSTTTSTRPPATTTTTIASATSFVATSTSVTVAGVPVGFPSTLPSTLSQSFVSSVR